jgi:hypothetical protein
VLQHASADTNGAVACRTRFGELEHPLHQTIKAYDYRDAATLRGDFWTTVDSVLRERGVIP